MDIFNQTYWLRLFAGLWLLTLSSFAIAADGPDELAELPAPLTADALAAQVIERNPSVAALQSALASAQATARGAGRLDDPMLAYELAPGSINSDLGDRHKFSISQKLPWPGTLDLQSQLAEHAAVAADEDLAAVKLRVISSAKRHFADWFYVHQALDYNLASQRLLAELLEVAATTYGAGRGAQQDVVAAQLREVQIRHEHHQLSRQRSVIQAGINALLNRPPLAGLPLPVMPEAAVPPALQAVLQDIGESQPALRATQARLDGAKSRVDLAEKAFYPDLRLMAGYNEFRPAEELRWTAGISLNIPLDRTRRRALRDQREAEKMQLNYQLQDMRAEYGAAIVAAHARWQEAQDSIELFNAQLLPFTQQYLDAARADYSSGNGDFAAVIEAETRLLTARTALARSLADRLSALAEIEQLSGGNKEVSK